MAEETSSGNRQTPTTQDNATAPTSQDNAPFNETLVKSAVSFLSSPNVQSADTAKKVAFLTKKGLSAKDIEEAFKRVNQEVPSVPEATTTYAAAVANTAPPAPLIPTRPTYQPGQPSVVYQPLPPPSALPIQRLIALSVLFGVGAVSVTAGIVSIVKRLLLPTFNAVVAYQTGRYQQQKTVLDKLGGQIAGEETAEEENAVEGQKEKKVDVSAQLAEKQTALAERLEQMVARAKARHNESKNNVDVYTGLGTAVADLRNTINSPEYMYTPSLYATAAPGLEGSNVHGLKGEIRSLKGILLNRRR